MFPSSQLGLARCPMCGLPKSNLHLAKDCSHWEIEEAREDAFLQLDTAMLESVMGGNVISESWAGAYQRP